MRNIVNVNERGTLTLPKELRLKLGLQGEGQVLAEGTDEGILLKPGAAFPIEIYTEERWKEFEENNEKALKKYVFKKRR